MGKAFKLSNGLLLVSTEAPGGVYNSAQLKKIAALCDGEAALVKATEDQRLALFVAPEKAARVAQDLKALGLGVRHYQDGLHQPVNCLGELCPEHLQDAMGASMDLARELAGITLGQPLKIGINGCARCCLATHTLDVSIIGDSNGYRISLGGKNSQIPEMASFMAEGVPAPKLPKLIAKVIAAYKELAQKDETLQEVMERCGSKKFIDALAPYSQDAHQADPFSGMGGEPGGPEGGDVKIETLPTAEELGEQGPEVGELDADGTAGMGGEPITDDADLTEGGADDGKLEDDGIELVADEEIIVDEAQGEPEVIAGDMAADAATKSSDGADEIMTDEIMTDEIVLDEATPDGTTTGAGMGDGQTAEDITVDETIAEETTAEETIASTDEMAGDDVLSLADATESDRDLGGADTESEELMLAEPGELSFDDGELELEGSADGPILADEQLLDESLADSPATTGVTGAELLEAPMPAGIADDELLEETITARPASPATAKAAAEPRAAATGGRSAPPATAKSSAPDPGAAASGDRSAPAATAKTSAADPGAAASGDRSAPPATARTSAADPGAATSKGRPASPAAKAAAEPARPILASVPPPADDELHGDEVDDATADAFEEQLNASIEEEESLPEVEDLNSEDRLAAMRLVESGVDDHADDMDAPVWHGDTHVPSVEAVHETLEVDGSFDHLGIDYTDDAFAPEVIGDGEAASTPPPAPAKGARTSTASGPAGAGGAAPQGSSGGAGSFDFAGLDVSADGKVQLLFASGARLAVDPRSLAGSARRELKIAGKTVVLAPDAGGLNVEVDGVAIYLPRQAA